MPTQKDPPAVHIGTAPDPTKIIQASGTATAAVAALRRRCWLVGLTKGQYSLLDLIRAVIQKTGPAEVRLSTWSTGIRDAETAAWLLQNGDITDLQLIVDRSFPGRQPAYAGRVTALFGDDAIVPTRVHAKVALILAGDWRIVIRSSMNLNRNPRFEQWDLNDDPQLYDFFAGWFDELEETAPAGLQFKEEEAQSAFERALKGQSTDGEVLAELTGGLHTEMPTKAKSATDTKRAVPPATGGDEGNNGPGAGSGSLPVSLPVADMSPLQFQEWLLAEALEGLRASEPGSIAHTNNMREVRNARKALDEERVVSAPPKQEPTVEERAQMLRERVDNASDEELEVAVQEWLRRRKYELRVLPGGGLTLIVEGDHRPDLRVVEG